MEIKKDWLYKSKSLVFGGVFLGTIVGVLFLILSMFINEANIEFMGNLYSFIYIFSLTMAVLYFSYCFHGVAPQFGSGKLYLNTINLPFSRKQLFLKGLKPWFIIFPIYLVFGAFINTVLTSKTTLPVMYAGYSFGMLFIRNLASAFWSFLYLFTIQLQGVSAIIFSLSKNIRWYIIIPCMILFNGLLIGLIIILGTLGIDMTASFASSPEITFYISWLDKPDFNIIFYWLNGTTLIFLLGSLLLFLFAFKNIENIHR